MDACAKESAATIPKAYVCPILLLLIKCCACPGGCVLKLLIDLFHVLMARVTTVVITAVSVLVFNWRPSPGVFLEAPSVLFSMPNDNAESNPQGVEYVPRKESSRSKWHSSGALKVGLEKDWKDLPNPKSDTNQMKILSRWYPNSW